jgi:glyoxylate/hydroxypyruvate reductase A
VDDPDAVEFALCWDQPMGVLERFPNLKCISSLGAGVEHLLSDHTRPEEVPLVRVVDEHLKQGMAEYVMHGVLEHFRRFDDYRSQAKLSQWKYLKIPHIEVSGIGIMGFGEIGRFVAYRLADFGFNVSGWSRGPKPADQVRHFFGSDKFNDFLNCTDILVCLLPLTPETENILDTRTFNQMPKGAFLINVGRGAHLVEDDLVKALDSGHLSGALLDVFREEPLPEDHPFWSHEKITVTPHIASVTNAATASIQIIENYRRATDGRPLIHQVDVGRGY